MRGPPPKRDGLDKVLAGAEPQEGEGAVEVGLPAGPVVGLAALLRRRRHLGEKVQEEEEEEEEEEVGEEEEEEED